MMPATTQNLGTGVWASVPAQYQPTIQAAAQQYNIPPAILAAVGKIESGYNPAVINGSQKSSAGAIGAFQFMPATAKAYGVTPTDFTSSAYGSAHYLSDLYAQYGSWTKALSAYNSGSPTASPGYAATVMAAATGTPGVAGTAQQNAAASNQGTSQPVKAQTAGLFSSVVGDWLKPVLNYAIDAGLIIGGLGLMLWGIFFVMREVK